MAEEGEYEFIIKEMGSIHCARGAARCPKCKEMQGKVQHQLLRLHLHGGKMARPTLGVIRNGKQEWLEFDVVKSFPSEEDAKDYCNSNNIPLMKQ